MPDNKRIDDLYELIDGIEIAMLTTRRADGRLVSRPMATQERQDDADLWFVTDIDTHKVDELEQDPNVNVAYYRDRTKEWVSVSGTAHVSQNREKIRELYKPDWRMWFEKVDEVRDGGPDDPRLALLRITAESVVYMKKDKSTPVVLFELAKGMVTGEQSDVGKMRELSGSELR
ncbi:MAG: pyridoxamine 5'-phosphate oxidase family protein [Longimicrobiales bacterium]